MAATIQNLTRENQTLTRKNQILTRENQNLTRENQNLTRENQTFARENQTFARENQTLTRDNQALTRENQNLTTLLATVERERDRLQNELRRAGNISRELNHEKMQFQERCEQLEREKMDIRNQIAYCYTCRQRTN